MADNISPTSGQPTQASGEHANGAPANQQSSEQNPSIFEGIDPNELPEDVRSVLDKAKTTFEKTLKEKADLEAKAKSTAEFARQQQSRADRFEHTLRSHNLLNANPTQPNQPASVEDELVAKFVKDGLKEEVARGYAKMFTTAGSLQQNQILSQVAPLAQTVAEMQANSHLAVARATYSQAFSIPEIAEHVQENVNALLKTGNVIDQPTVDHLVKMAYGDYAMRNPNAMNQQQQQQTQQIPSFRGGIVSGGAFNQSKNQPQQGPTATQPETLSIMSAIKAEMTRDLPKKGGR